MWGHSGDGSGRRQLLARHLENTGVLAAQFAAPFGGAPAGRLLGLAHDVGKASCAWQDGLLRTEAHGGTVGVEHKTSGVRIAQARGVGDLGLALHGHHGGLTDRQEVDDAVDAQLRSEALRRNHAEAVAATGRMFPELFSDSPLPLPDGFDDPLTRDMLVRFLFSALVDADALDTQAHFLGLRGARVRADADMSVLWRRYEHRRKDALARRPASAVDKHRHDVYEACVAAARLPTGLFRLSAPTGSGKTLSAGAFALCHAAMHGKKRVIVAVPFMTITEQNAEEYRRLLDPTDGELVVLEHHSNVVADADGRGERWRRLAAENWDAPFVVTTTVQLFESLFGRRPAQMRKVHRLANAVIVLDEVQALPPMLLVPIVDALRRLSERFGTTVLLASATQPELVSLSPLSGIPVVDVIQDPEPMYRALRRVRYRWQLDPKPTLAEIAKRVAGRPFGHGQVLVVVNTVADARDLATTLLGEVDGSGTAMFHLSTAMCPAHRREVLADVRQLLSAGEPVLLVSTQLIEAGVDVDFPVVFRALAPADSLQQAAGRANREGRLGDEGGTVVVFEFADRRRLRAYDTAVGVTGLYMGPGLADPDDHDALADYYTDLYTSLDVEGQDKAGATIQRNREDLDFRAVTDGPRLDVGMNAERDRKRAFKMIDADTRPVVVRHHSAAEQVRTWLGQLRTSPTPPPGVFRKLQPYVVMVRRTTLDESEVRCRLDPVVPGLDEWCGAYSELTGLVTAINDEE